MNVYLLRWIAILPAAAGRAARGREEGQALIEYALILFLVALVVIGILGTVGLRVSSMFSTVVSEF